MARTKAVAKRAHNLDAVLEESQGGSGGCVEVRSPLRSLGCSAELLSDPLLALEL